MRKTKGEIAAQILDFPSWHTPTRRSPRTRSPRKSSGSPVRLRGPATSPFIPEGVGPCQASSLGKFVDFLWVSRTGERHTPTPSGAESLCRGIPGLWVAVFSSVLMRTVERSGIARSLFIPSPPTRVAWSVTAAARRGQSRQVDHATGGGGQNGNDLACWLSRAVTHAGRARQRMCPSRSP